VEHVHHGEGHTYIPVVHRKLTPFIPLPLKAKLSKVTIQMAILAMEPHLSWVVGSLSYGYGSLLEVLVELLEGFPQGWKEVY
jgi:hypothetical protein